MLGQARQSVVLAARAGGQQAVPHRSVHREWSCPDASPLIHLDGSEEQVRATAEEMGQFFDHLRQVGIRGPVAEKLNDSE